MDNSPLIAYVGCIIIYRIVESSASIRAGSWKPRPKWDWTLFAVIGSFLLALTAPAVEFLGLGTHPGPISYVLGGVLFLAAAFVRARGLLDLGKGFSMAVEVREGQQLVETGLYHHIRHPLYLGVFCLFLACPVFLDARWSFLVSSLGFLAVYARIRKEEAFLAEHLPGYREYMERTWRVMPGVW